MTCELDDLLDEWIDVADDIECERGYPDLSAEMPLRLIAGRYSKSDTEQRPESRLEPS